MEKFAIPLVKKIYPKLISTNLVSVQPMTRPIFRVPLSSSIPKPGTIITKGWQLININTMVIYGINEILDLIEFHLNNKNIKNRRRDFPPSLEISCDKKFEGTINLQIANPNFIEQLELILGEHGVKYEHKQQ